MNLTNQFLIAMPSLADPNFYRTVTYMCAHSEEGAMGIVINRPTDLKLADVLGQMSIPANNDAVNDMAVLQGGPVCRERGFVLHQPAGEWDSTLRVSDEIGIATSRDILSEIAEGRGPEQSLIALGYAGWGAGTARAGGAGQRLAERADQPEDPLRPALRRALGLGGTAPRGRSGPALRSSGPRVTRALPARDPPPQTLLAFDPGHRHIGVAVGQTLTGTATPLATLPTRKSEPDWPALARLVESWEPQAMVVGLPLNMDGTEQDTTRLARRFRNELKVRFGVPVHFVDERLSTREARDRLAREGRAGEEDDAVAAQVILEDWFAQRARRELPTRPLHASGEHPAGRRRSPGARAIRRRPSIA